MDRRRRLLRYTQQSGEVNDPFNDRDNATGMGKAPSGQAWVEAANTFTVVNGCTGGQATTTAATTTPLVETGLRDCSVQATFAVVANGARLVARTAEIPHSGGSNQLFVNLAAGNFTLQRRMFGSNTTLGTYAVAPANGDVVKLTMRGNKLEVFVNGTSRITATDGWSMHATRHGIQFGTTACQIDNFTVTRI